MHKRSLAAGAAAAAVAVLTAVPATASAASQTKDAQATPVCATSQLTAKLVDGGVGAGNLYLTLVLTNHSATACHVTGFPGVSLLDSGGKQIGPAATRVSQTYAAVQLKPGASASDTIHTANHMGTCLPTSAQVRVYPPGNTASLVVPGQIAACHGELQITPLTAGASGNPEGGSTPTSAPTSAPSSAPSTAPAGSGHQVPVVPSGAPDTGLAATSGASNTGTVIGATTGGVLLLGGAGVAFAVRRRSRVQAQG